TWCAPADRRPARRTEGLRRKSTWRKGKSPPPWEGFFLLCGVARLLEGEAESEGDGSVDASDADSAGGVISARCARKEGHRGVDSEVYDEGVGYVQLVPGASANAEEEDIGRFGR